MVAELNKQGVPYRLRQPARAGARHGDAGPEALALTVGDRPHVVRESAQLKEALTAGGYSLGRWCPAPAISP
jgi:hypothetical protein